ncbi:MAG: nitronate monooxygenase, partial [Pseudomonadota bacterium]
MQTDAMKMFGLAAPIFAFSHCRDVVAAVSKAGGMGTLGTTRDSVEDLEQMLSWIDDHVDEEPYGVDIMFASNAPREFESMTAQQIIGLVPE